MAKVVVQRTWADGENLLIEVAVAASYPDAIAEAKQQALNAYAGALEITLASDAENAPAEDDGA